MKATAIKRDCKSPYSAPANCKFAGTGANGQAYFSQALDYIGGNEHSYYSMTNKDPDSYDNVDMAGKLITTAGLYTYIEGMLHYSEILGKWMDKQGTRRPLYENGNAYTGGKIKYGKAMSNKFTTAGRVLGGVGVVLSAIQFNQFNSDEDKIMCAFDIMIGSAGVAAPQYFGTFSTFWFLGGRQITKWYGAKVITPMIEEGINPGLMIYQPFK